MYYQETCYAGDTVEICKYHASYNRAKGQPRQKRKKPTSEEQFKVNERQAEKKLRRLINHNFHPGDYHLTLSYKKELRPENKEGLKKDIRRFHNRVRKEYRKRGLPYKYIHVFEIGKRGAMHHHMVVNQIDIDILRKAWDKGRIKVSPLDDTGQYSELASYLIKYSSVMLRSENRLQGKRWNPSRNLDKPKIVKKPVHRNTFQKVPREKKGYYIDKNLSCDFVDTAGYRHMQTVYVKTRKRRE